MAKLFKLLKINLGLFDGAAAPAGGEGGEAGESGGEQTLPLNTRKGAKSGEQVVFGKPPEDGTKGPDAGDAAKQEKPALTPEEKRKAYNELISGEYKDIHTQTIQDLFNRRFKDVKTLEETSAKQKAAIEPLMQKYGVADVDALAKAINEDGSIWEEAAAKAGMPVQQFKEFMRMQRENAQLNQQKELTQAQEQAKEQAQKWLSESEALKKTPGYENFKLETEWDNPEFQKLLKSGIDVKHAYDVLHIDDIKQTVAADTAKQTEKQVTDNVRARGARPSENGVSSSTGIVYKSDVSKLTPKDRKLAAEQAMRGVKIDFKS